jgi:1-acyl-sn-glycerol-3-phosphate acyltransferase
MYDIIAMIWFYAIIVNFRQERVRKGIPSVSYNLRHGGSALIDRKDPNKPFLK